MAEGFDVEATLKAVQSGQSITGKDGVPGPLVKQLTEAALDSHRVEELAENRKNGKSKKTVKSTSGEFELETPRDRAGTFEPQLVKRHQRTVSDEIESKILSMYGLGMSDADIAGHVEEMYGISVSMAAISTITDKLIDAVKAWQARPLETLYPFVWLDAIHYKIRDKGRYQNKAIYTVLALNMEGKKEVLVLGLYLSESEGANFGLSVLTDLHNRGVEDILSASVDGLTGFPEAIASIYPDTEVQLCIVHQIRNSLRYVASKNHKAFMVDLKRVYRAASLGEAELALDELEFLWGEKYPIVIKSWRTKWEHLSAYFKYPEDIRRIIYTANSIEAVHRQFRKLTKSGFPNNDSLLKLLFMGIQNASKKWTMPIQNWNLTLSQLSIFFEGRLDAALKL